MKLHILLATILLGLGSGSCGFMGQEEDEDALFEQKILTEEGLPRPSLVHRQDTAVLNGVLGRIAYLDIKRVLGAGLKPKVLVLGKVPGSLSDYWNLQACSLVYHHNITTLLRANSVVESGGTDLFAAGKKLVVEEGAHIGVHSWGGDEQTPDGNFLPKLHPEHVKYLKLYNMVEIDTSFYWFTLRMAPADSIHIMTETEIKHYFGNKLTFLE